MPRAVDGGERGHHAGDAHPGEVDAARGHLGQRAHRAPAPGLARRRARAGPGAGVIRRCGMRARARTVPVSSAATAFTAVVPMSMPTVTEPDTTVMIRPL